MIDEVNPGGGSSNIFHLTQVDTMIFFRAYHVHYGAELFAYNQNTGVVELVKDIWPGSSGSSFPDELISYQGKLIFQGHDGVYGQELWISDGTEEGTKMLKNINVEAGLDLTATPIPENFMKQPDSCSFKPMMAKMALNSGKLTVLKRVR